jgi:UDP-N-acetylmuramate--alanine ligase
MYKHFERVHFVGIGGVGMSGIAEVLKNLGYEVGGSDLRESETTRRLRSLGIDVHIGHSKENLKKADVVVISSAVSEYNPEVEEARRMDIPVIPRAEMLAELARMKNSVLIAGAHGKTTTTSLVASVLGEGGFDPTVVIGGKLRGIGSNARLGQGEFLIAEADESDGSFLKLSPTIAVITNIDREHIDYFGDMSRIKEAFVSFANKVPFYGLNILYGDNQYVKEILPEIRRRCITYGLGQGVDLMATDIRVCGLESCFRAVLNGASIGEFTVPLIGRHNVCNCLAAIAVAGELGMDMETVRKALREFSGVHRRFEYKGTVSGIRVIDDYGHHPAEIMATLKAAHEAIHSAEEKAGRLVVLFQPHRYTRTRDLMDEFFGAFTDADKVVVTEIYPAGEKPIPGVTAEALSRGIGHLNSDVVFISDMDDVLDYLERELRENDTLITLGAGDVWKAGEEFIRRKRQQK